MIKLAKKNCHLAQIGLRNSRLDAEAEVIE
jgi:hypothetical protein